MEIFTWFLKSIGSAIVGIGTKHTWEHRMPIFERISSFFYSLKKFVQTKLSKEPVPFEYSFVENKKGIQIIDLYFDSDAFDDYTVLTSNYPIAEAFYQVRDIRERQQRYGTSSISFSCPIIYPESFAKKLVFDADYFYKNGIFMAAILLAVDMTEDKGNIVLKAKGKWNVPTITFTIPSPTGA